MVYLLVVRAVGWSLVMIFAPRNGVDACVEEVDAGIAAVIARVCTGHSFPPPLVALIHAKNRMFAG